MTSRRDFLKGALAGTGAVATATVTTRVEARAARERSPDAVGMLFDGTLCIGCKACVSACKEVNNLPLDYNSPVEALWDMPLDTTARTFNVIKAYKDGDLSRKDAVENGYAFSKTSCYHCVDPSCVSACPVSAMSKDKVTGIVAYDPNACIGCRYCVVACPFGIPKFDYDSPTGAIGKCELCRHRMPDGHYAACAEVCPTGATLFGKVDDLLEEARRRITLEPGGTALYPRGDISDGPDRSWEGPVAHYQPHIYGEHEGGGTQVLHIGAIPYQKLGLPTLPETSYASRSEGLQHGLYSGLILPLTLFGAMTWAAKRNSRHDEEEEGGEK